ncbi:phosphatase PAP2 family protein [Streptomyces sp. NPDC002886]|uniref:phosphatase PAP2 family protein n=1 Tax=Streptomyces sp. NPDC002886 TaxID=3364667 RepID=UPI0036AE3006
MTTTLDPRPTESRSARLITDGLDPKTWIILDTLLIGWHTAGVAGIGWGLLGCLFAAVIPLAFIKYGIRRGRWADRHVGQRQQRIVVLVFIIGSVTTGIVLMALLGSPRTMIALIAAMLVTLAGLLAVTPAWKISVHAAVSSGSVAMLAMTYGPWLLLAYPLVAVVGWSRVELKDHTLAQVIAGTAMGAAVAATTFGLVR